MKILIKILISIKTTRKIYKLVPESNNNIIIVNFKKKTNLKLDLILV